jgi:FKBP-type peptidyl-prolyl cis-trans isomerase
MRKVAIVLVLNLMLINLFSQEAGLLKNTVDSTSYALGVSMFLGAQKMDFGVNLDLLITGIRDASQGTAGFNEASSRDYVMAYLSKLKEIENQKVLETEKKFLLANRKEEGIIETESGLQYRVIKQGLGDKPKATDKVKVDYVGYLTDGTKFDSSIDRGDTAVFSVNQVIKGWTEVLQLMPVGSQYVVYVPSALAYGERSMGRDIKPYSTLIFEITLYDIVK